MSAPQLLSGIAAPGAQAAATLNAPGAAGTTNLVARLRSLCATLTGEGGAAVGTLVICDGPSNSATSALAIWSIRMAAASGSSQTVALDTLDLRASPGNNLTIGFIAGSGGSTVQSVNGIGDFIPLASPAYFLNT